MGRAAVYTDNDFGSELVGLKSMSVKIIPSSKIIGAPVETGVTSFDNKVLEPTKVVVKGIVTIGDPTSMHAMNSIDQMADNRDFSFYSATDGQNCVNNLILESAPSTRDSNRFDFIEYELIFKEALLVQGSPESSGENSDFQNNGYSAGVVS